MACVQTHMMCSPPHPPHVFAPVPFLNDAMGAAESKHAEPMSEKRASAYDATAASAHHSAQRLARLQAEDSTCQVHAPGRIASADITPQSLKQWQEDAFAVRSSCLPSHRLHAGCGVRCSTDKAQSLRAHSRNPRRALPP